MNSNELADEIINGRRLTSSDSFTFNLFKNIPLEELCIAADKIQKHFQKDRVELCAITSGKNGKCSENCKFCAQSSWYKTNCHVQDYPSPEELLQIALEHSGKGIKRFSIVSSGKGILQKDYQKVLDSFALIHKNTEFNLCASLGFLTDEQLAALKRSGVSRIHCNLETSKRYFPKICTTHSFEMKIDMIKRAKAAGFSICSGGIIGMGETIEDRIDFALTLAELKVDSIPVNVLNPIPGTPFEKLSHLSEEEIMQAIAIFRFINPQADIRLAGGRTLYNFTRAFTSGASSSVTGNYLTTSGYSVESDKKILMALGKEITV